MLSAIWRVGGASAVLATIFLNLSMSRNFYLAMVSWWRFVHINWIANLFFAEA